MKKETYKELTLLLNLIEFELNKIALAVGHDSYEEFNRKINI